jgi:alkanesulfonate monooxygenase SsuD/methylene tetrahydromethanopterin reductase-like flavin-dependent oxidoreductase (luciferase family)
MMNDEDRAFIAKYAPGIALCGGVGAEQWRPTGFEESIRSIQILDTLEYPAWGFTEQTHSWYFRSGWTSDLVPTASLVPDCEAFYDTFALIAAAGSQTKQIRLFTTTDCYRRPPSLLAQTMLTLDHITQGRVGVRIGTGEDKQFVPHGLERKAPQNGRLEEFIGIVKALMRTTEPLTLDGGFWPQRDALIALPSHHPDAPPPVILVGGGPVAMKIAGRVADGVGT